MAEGFWWRVWPQAPGNCVQESETRAAAPQLARTSRRLSWGSGGCVYNTGARCCGDEAVLGIILTMIPPVDRSVLPPGTSSFVASSGEVFRGRQAR